MSSSYDFTLRSKESIEPARLLIINKTKRSIEILWISYVAKLVPYKTLKPETAFKINTFKTHPWVFRDRLTGILMHTNHKEVLWPEKSTEQCPIQKVYIHFPLFSLKMISLWTVVPRIKGINEIDHLEIPSTLRRDLDRIFRQYNQSSATASQRI